MDAAALRAMQAPIKERYKSAPEAALVTLKAKGALDATNIACKVETGRALAVAGLHPATGGSGLDCVLEICCLEARPPLCRRHSQKHNSSPEPPVAGCRPATARARRSRPCRQCS